MATTREPRRGVDRAAVLAQCTALPGAELTHPFGEHVAVFKVGGRAFAYVGMIGEPCRVSVRATPEQVDQLVRAHAAVARGYHDRWHWVTLTLGDDLPAGLLEALLDDSHERAVAALPARRRPTAPGIRTADLPGR
ncbi:MAG: DNA-binding protein [Mycobacterium sp.]|nr:DNA-binding protein [Mycobacterium sp.]